MEKGHVGQSEGEGDSRCTVVICTLIYLLDLLLGVYISMHYIQYQGNTLNYHTSVFKFIYSNMYDNYVYTDTADLLCTDNYVSTSYE